MNVLKYFMISLIFCFNYSPSVYGQEFQTSPPPCQCEMPAGCTDGITYSSTNGIQFANCFCQGGPGQYGFSSAYKQQGSNWICINNEWCTSQDCDELKKHKKRKKPSNPSTE